MKRISQYLSLHLLVSVTVCFIIGIILSRQLRFPSDSSTPLLHFFFLIFPIIAYCLHKKKNHSALWLILFLATGTGIQQGLDGIRPPGETGHIYNRISEKTEVILIGTLVSMPSYNGKNSRIIIKTESIRLQSSPSILPTTGKIILSYRGIWPDQFEPGNRLVIRADLKRPTSYKAPGVFDYAQYLAVKGIWVTGFIRSPLFINKIKKQETLLEKSRYLPERIRVHIGNEIDKTISPGTASIYRALLLGDRSRIDQDTLELFKGSGLMHILAVSGMHMAVVGTLLFTSFYWLLRRSEYLLLRISVAKWAACFCIPPLICYSLLTGMNVPVVRAVIMSCIVIFAMLFDRCKSASPLVALAALSILLTNPLHLYTPSFQLSFAAIISILFVLPVIKEKLLPSQNSSNEQRAWYSLFGRYFLLALLVSIVATLGTAPFSIFHFHRLAIVGPVANLIIEPLLCLWSLPVGFLSILFAYISPEISRFLLHLGSYGIELSIIVAEFFSSLPFATQWLPTPPLKLFVFYYIFFILISQLDIHNTKLILASSGAFLSITFFIICQDIWPSPSPPKTLQIYFLDVGQGNSSYLEFPSGKRILVDGGGSSFSTQTVGERVIAPFLWNRGVRKIDAIVVTHPDADHYNGLGFIVNHFTPKSVWVRDTYGHDMNYRDFIKTASDAGAVITVAQRGERFTALDNEFECIANLLDKEQNGGNTSIDNNSSLILKAGFGNFTTLFPGDIESPDERKLVDGKYDLGADILLAPHHGSITSNSPDFLQAVSPRHLIVSASHSNKGRFPHQGLAEICDTFGITLLSTAFHGTITINTHENGYSILGMKRYNDNIFHPLESFLIETTKDKFISNR